MEEKKKELGYVAVAKRIENVLKYIDIREATPPDRQKYPYLYDERSREYEDTSQMSQDIDFLSLVNRLKTYEAKYWSKQVQSVLDLARYGWECANENTVRCSQCQKTEDFLSYTDHTTAATLPRNGHKLACRWAFYPAPDDFLQLPTDGQVMLEYYLVSIQSLLSLDVSLPYVSEDIFSDVPPQDIEMINFLGTVLDLDQHPRAVNASATLLGLCGWVRGRGKNTIECRYCQRMVGLWNFVSVHDKTNPPSLTESPHESEHETEDEVSCITVQEGSDEVEAVLEILERTLDVVCMSADVVMDVSEQEVSEKSAKEQGGSVTVVQFTNSELIEGVHMGEVVANLTEKTEHEGMIEVGTENCSLLEEEPSSYADSKMEESVPHLQNRASNIQENAEEPESSKPMEVNDQSQVEEQMPFIKIAESTLESSPKSIALQGAGETSGPNRRVLSKRKMEVSIGNVKVCVGRNSELFKLKNAKKMEFNARAEHRFWCLWLREGCSVRRWLQVLDVVRGRDRFNDREDGYFSRVRAVLRNYEM